MTNKEFFDIGRVAYITGNVQEALVAKQALEKVVENANSLQQLKAEIAYYLDGGEEHIDAGIVILPIETFNKLRQLSVI